MEKTQEVEQVLEDKLIGMLDALENGAVQVGEQVVKYSPEVADAALWVIRIDSAQALLSSLAWLFVCVIPAIFFYKLAKKFAKEENGKHGDAEAVLWSGAFSAIFTGAAMIPASGLFNLWNWIGMFEPKLKLAKDIIERVI